MYFKESDIKILIVEDSSTETEELKNILEEKKYQVLIAENSSVALEMLKQNKPKILIIDILVAEMEGYQLCKEIKSNPEYKDILVILLTSLSESKDIIKGLECGADSFIIKPFKKEYLFSQIQHLIINQEYSKNILIQEGLNIIFKEEKYHITVDKMQILNLLISSYEIAVMKNKDLLAAKNELIDFNEPPDKKIEDKTAELRAEIQEHKHILKELIESEERYRTIIENSNDMIWILDKEGKFVVINKKAEELSGYKIDEWLGKNFETLVVKEDLEKIKKILLETLSGVKKRYEVKYYKKDGSIADLAVNSVPFYKSGEIIGAICFCGDITKRKQMDKEKEKLQAQIIQVQKIEVVGTLADGIVHDFNNILTSIQGNVTLAMMDANPEEPIYEDLQEICKATKRGANITRQLLLFSRQQPPTDMTSININNVISNMLKTFTRLIGEDIVIKTDLKSDIWQICADIGNIEQILMNLLINARDAMPNGGKVVIKTENIKLDEEYFKTVSFSRPGNFVCIMIEDNGMGVSKENMQYIFEPFFTTKGVGKGTGLGLSIVYGIVKQHQGWINVYSKPGQGTIFKTYIPAIFVEEKKEIKETVEIKNFHGNGKKVLIVEDEESIRTVLSKVLHKNGYIVHTAADGREAFEVLENNKYDFNLILCDMIMPDKTGIQLIDEIIPKKPDIKILLSSGYTEEKSQFSEIKERKIKFLQKPYDMTNLLKTMKEIIE